MWEKIVLDFFMRKGISYSGFGKHNSGFSPCLRMRAHKEGEIWMLSWLPENVSTFGGDIDFIFYLIYYITTVVFLLVTVLMILFLVKYRYQEGRRAVYTHGNTALEILWTVVPALILILLAFMSAKTWGDVKITQPPEDPGDVRVEVTAQQFEWLVRYPGPDGKFATEDDIELRDDLRVPVDTVVRITLKAKEVIHSFFLPNFRLKQDAVPGREIPVWFKATKPGKYELPCAELCGVGHSGMRGWVTVYSADEYKAWVKEKWPSS
jgi:cytochrome c oxidase subunit 2